MKRTSLFTFIAIILVTVFATLGCQDKPVEDEVVAKGGTVATQDFNADAVKPVEVKEEPAPEQAPVEADKETGNEAKPVVADPKPGAEASGATPEPESDAPKTKVALGGCLKTRQESKGERRSTPTGGEPQDEVTITKGDVSIVVEHKLTHNCCFDATVTTKINGNNISVLEALAGERVCRCVCNSTITTEIDLRGRKEFKEYKIKVEVDNNGQPGTTHNETFSYVD